MLERLQRLREFLVAPHGRIAAPQDRRGARLLAMLATAIIPVLLTAMVFSSWWVLGVLGIIVAASAVQLALSTQPPRWTGTGLALLVVVGVTGALVIIFRRHFAGLEADRMGEIRRKEEARRESERRLQALLANSTDMFLVLDPGAAILLAAGAFKRITGRADEEIIGTSVLEAVHPEDRQSLRAILEDVASSPGSRSTAQWRHGHADGGWRWLEAVITNCLDVPGVSGLVANLRDVAERREAEEQRRKLESRLQQTSKMESIGRLAGGVAHDFNNLLTVIQGNTELARAALQPGHPADEALLEVRQATQRAAALTRQLLAFSRRQIIEPRLVNLNDLIIPMLSMLTRLLGEDVVLQTTLAPDLWTVRVDSSLIEQILVNLAANARDAMPEGGTLRIETANVSSALQPPSWVPAPEKQDHVLLTVRDTGVGMSEEIKRQIFEPFFTTKSPGKGTGLGLATVYGAARQSDGYVEVDSQPGRGSTFRIYFPRVQDPAQSVARPGDSAPAVGHGETVLLVEDEHTVRDLVVRLLRRLGYRVLQAGGGEEALSQAQDHPDPIHLLITDVVMPGMNGRELAAALAHLHAETRVLYCSGYTDDVITHHGVLEKGVHFIPKPFTIVELARRIREVLDPPREGVVQAPEGR